MRDAALTEEPVAMVKALIPKTIYAYPFESCIPIPHQLPACIAGSPQLVGD